MTEKPVFSSLPLQMCLHFHFYLLPYILFAQIYCFVIKYEYLHPIYQVVLMAVQLVSIMVELIRPYLGYYGNLAEKIPALSGFWTVSLILQMPITLFLNFNQAIYPLPLERFIYSVHFVLLAVEVFISGFIIRRLANHQTALFKQRLDRKSVEHSN